MPDTTILPLLNRIAASARIDDAWDLATGYFSGLGFGRVNYGFTRFMHQKTIGDPDDALFLSTCDADYVRRYFQGGFYAKTPLFRWAETNAGICTWSWVAEAYAAGRLSPQEAEAVRQNIAMGIVAGITVSFPEVLSRSKGAIGLIADPGVSLGYVEAIFAERREEILAVANMMHLTIVHLPQLSRHRALSPRQREALEWVADGKTTQDVALLMGVSPAMVEKHLRLAREALAVETTAQAVAKGALLNMIFQRAPETARAAR
ncbi:helix-turn-helix transcriptional regulator [Rhodobacter calidifons]|uniref:LuxR family transcriptional regulator n=1 Tax=Rhodobacter calidifons TaxID=2715277 RepID=A0ABX0G8W0_9RHOB|nr:LuxR family transcriptional regulator [Rhodobacter calidifons]NHB77292.1 LuxR family transcriptional regulator [Rhodobacter calidifons]